MASPTTTLDPTALPAGAWELDPTHSSAGFAVKHMVVATFRGRFEQVAATLQVAEDGSARLAGTVRADSIVVKDENLAAHLKAPDFFDVERYPEIQFTSSDLRRTGDQIVVRGDLTIKGHTNPIEAHGTITGPAETLGGAIKVGLSLEAVVDREKYGLNWNAPLPRGGVALANDVTLIVDLELAQAGALA